MDLIGAGPTPCGSVAASAPRRELRWVLVEAAQTAVRSHPYWQRAFARLERRIGEQKAIVALARKLLVVIWHMLHSQSADRRADAERVAFKLMVWSWKLTDTHGRCVPVNNICA